LKLQKNNPIIGIGEGIMKDKPEYRIIEYFDNFFGDYGYKLQRLSWFGLCYITIEYDCLAIAYTAWMEYFGIDDSEIVRCRRERP